MASGAGVERPPSRPLVFSIAALVTAGGVLGTLYLGAWAFDVRRFSTHETRLARLLAHEPTLSQVDQAFKDEGTLLLGSAEGDAALRALAQRFARDKAAAVSSSGRAYPLTKAYLAGDMIYFIHFDERRVMCAFVIVSH